MSTNSTYSEHPNNYSIRFKRWLKEKHPSAHGFFFSEPPFYIRWFFPILVLLGLVGGMAALWIPSNTGWLRQSGLSGEAEQKSISDLRLHFLYITGGIIAILTLLQTNWKNQVDRRKVDADIKKNEQDVEKNALDHTRQVHAERRGRYTKAVEQLANEKATVRLGGIYTLVGLVDEWFADDTLDSEEQQKEGQVIINNLCSYIRSPFPVAEKIEEYEAHKELKKLEEKEPEERSVEEYLRIKALHTRFKESNEYKNPEDITADYAKLHEEQDVRRTIFVEMSKRSSTFTRDENDKVIDTFPGLWSDFEFDFSRAPIFYPLSALTIEKANFSFAKFYSNADFNRTVFVQKATFYESSFTQRADFMWATFTQGANFMGASFTQDVYFQWATFTQSVGFGVAKFAQYASFRGATFTQIANFSSASFAQRADFVWAKFIQDAIFSSVSFIQTADFKQAKFTQYANFKQAKFTQYVDFRGTKFTQTANFEATFFAEDADFRGAIFVHDADFRGAIFVYDVVFLGATFTQNANFTEVTFKNSEPIFSLETSRAKFSAFANPQDYLFDALPQSAYGFSYGAAELLNKTFILPLGAVLYDPDSWDEEKQEYTRVSEPAQ